MNPGDNEALWRGRMLIYSAVLLGGIAIVFLGVAIIYTDVLRKGGWPQLGAVVAIMGAIDALFAPRLLKRAWDDQDKPDR